MKIFKWFLVVFLLMPFLVIAQSVTPTPVPTPIVEPAIFGKIVSLLTAYSVIFVAALEFVLRMWTKSRSIISYLGKILHGLGDVVFKVSDLISTVIPDRKPEVDTKTEIPK